MSRPAGLAIRRALIASARAALQCLAPAHCAGCDAPVCADSVFCSECGPCPGVDEVESAADGIRVAGSYAPPLSTAILRMKFGQRADLAYRLAGLLPLVRGDVAPGSLVVPVPLHLIRLCERGFNPSALMAACFAERAGATFAPRLLERLRNTPHQSSLPARERRPNVADAFEVRSERSKRGSTGDAAGRQVVLVDDVVTTGSTIEACRRALYAAGVVHVRVIALARA